MTIHGLPREVPAPVLGAPGETSAEPPAAPDPTPVAATVPALEPGSAEAATAAALDAFSGDAPVDPSLTGEASPFGAAFWDVVIHRRQPMRPFAIVERNIAVYRVRRSDGEAVRLDGQDAALGPNLDRTAPLGARPERLRPGPVPTGAGVSVYVRSPHLGGQPIRLRLGADDLVHGEDGRPLPGPVGTHVGIAPWTEGGLRFKPLATDEHGDFQVEPGDRRLAVLTAFSTANRVWHLADRYLGKDPRWGKDGVLRIVPFREDAWSPRGLNASFSSSSGTIQFDYLKGRDYEEEDNVAGPLPPPLQDVAVSMANAADVVSHEAGHAIFESQKPRTALVYHKGPRRTAFKTVREAFADVVSLLDGFHQPAILNAALSESQGDLRRPNRIAAHNEAKGGARAGLVSGGDAPGRRSALAPDVFDPAAAGTISPHAGSKPLTSAVYELIVRRYEARLARGERPGSAARHASEEVAPLVFEALAQLPDASGGTLATFAEAMVAADATRHDGALQRDLLAAFEPHGLLDANAIAKVEGHLRAVPELRIPAAVRDGSPDDADTFLAAHRDALGWPDDPPLHAAKIDTDRAGYTRIVFRSPIDLGLLGTTREEVGKDLHRSPEQLDAFLTRAAAFLLVGPDGTLVDAGLDAPKEVDLSWLKPDKA